MDLSHLAAMVMRHWKLVVAVVAVVSVLTLVVTSMMPKDYTAETTLIVAQSGPDANPTYDQLLAGQRLSQTFAELATTNGVLDRVRARLGLAGSVESLQGRLSAQAAGDSPFLRIQAHASTANDAAVLANAVAAELIASSPLVVGGTPATSTSLLHVVDRAVAPDTATSPRVLLSVLLAAAGSLTMMLVAISLTWYLRSPADGEAAGTTDEGRVPARPGAGVSVNTASPVPDGAGPAPDPMGWDRR